jgi:hypothetical protein
MLEHPDRKRQQQQQQQQQQRCSYNIAKIKVYGLKQGCKIPGRQIAVATKFFTDICGSRVRNLLLTTFCRLEF